MPNPKDFLHRRTTQGKRDPIQFLREQPLPERQAFQEAVELGRPRIGETTASLFTEQILPGLLPTAGMLGGAALGGLAAGPTVAGVPAGVLAGEAVGGAAGEALNQLFGITEPSATQVGLSAAAPGAGRAIGGVGSRLIRGGAKRFIPGTSVVLQEEAVQTARNLSQRFAPIKVSEQLFKELATVNPELRIPTTNVKAFARKLLEQEKTLAEEGSRVLQVSTLRDLAEDLLAPPGRAKQLQAQLKNLQTTSPIVGPRGEAVESTLALAQRTSIVTQLEKIGTEKFASPEGMRLMLKRVGQRTGAARGLISNEERDAFKGLYAALQQDIDDAIAAGGEAGEAIGLLRVARESVRREHATLQLADLIETKAIFTREGDLLQSIRPKKFLEAFNSPKNRVMRESFSRAEQKEIIDTIKSLKGLRGLPPAGEAGSMNLLGRSAAVGFGSTMLGLDPQTTALLSLGTAGVPWLISKVVVTETGRRIMRRVLTPSGFLDHRGLSILAAFVRAQSASTPER